MFEAHFRELNFVKSAVEVVYKLFNSKPFNTPKRSPLTHFFCRKFSILPLVETRPASVGRRRMWTVKRRNVKVGSVIL